MATPVLKVLLGYGILALIWSAILHAILGPLTGQPALFIAVILICGTASLAYHLLWLAPTRANAIRAKLTQAIDENLPTLADQRKTQIVDLGQGILARKAWFDTARRFLRNTLRPRLNRLDTRILDRDVEEYVLFMDAHIDGKFPSTTFRKESGDYVFENENADEVRTAEDAIRMAADVLDESTMHGATRGGNDN